LHFKNEINGKEDLMCNRRFIIALMLVIAMFFSMPAITDATPEAAANVGVNINGVSVNFNTDYGFPFIDPNSRTLVPLRITMEAYGCMVGWDQLNSMASVSKGDKTVLVPIGKSYILINGAQTPIDTYAQIVNGRTYLPIRSVLEAFGATVGWDAPTRTVTAINPDAPLSYEIALLSGKVFLNDMSLNQATWEGISSFATQNGISHKYYLSQNDSTDAIMESIQTAVDQGAKVIIASGINFAESIFLAQDLYKDVTFILLDSNPTTADFSVTRTRSNTVGITYKEEQAGYLAGYAIVKEGYSNLGFIGGIAVPAVVKYGYGFLQGAQDAAEELGIQNIKIKYHYSGVFWETPKLQSTASSWYSQGVEVIFAAAGPGGRSVMSAAEAAQKKVIGVDIDQSTESATVLTSAMKGLSISVQAMLAAYKTGQFPGGESLLLGAEENAVQLPMTTSKFNIFSQSDYERIFQALANGSITPPTDATAESPTELDLANITVTLIE
jgi:basic membrane protein A and related proteins